jgi:Flp pilus assembly pilin Flp
MIAPNPHPKSLMRRLRDDRSGATLIEFAFVGPILILLVMGIFDMAHTQYTSALLNGAIQKAGRDMTLESAGSRIAAVDARVRAQVQTVVPNTATIEFERLSHFDFSDIGEPEEFDDFDGNGTCNGGEPYIESNGTAGWQDDRGEAGIGGARDAVLYTAIVSYPRLFPVHAFTDMPSTVTLRASTVLRNQPFDEQDRSTEVGQCS